MKRFHRIYSLPLLASLFFSAPVFAEPQATAAESNQSAHPAPQRIRDPFTPSAMMYESAGAQPGNGSSAYGFSPSPSVDGMRVPNMKLRGLLNQAGDEFIALLEVAGVGTFMVREGDEFNIDPSQPKNAIRIDKITRLSVTVETGMLGSIRVLR